MSNPQFHKFPAGSTDRTYDVFEEFPDGSSVWRSFVVGMESAELKLEELAQKSTNKFFAVCLLNRDAPFDLPSPHRVSTEQKRRCA